MSTERERKGHGLGKKIATFKPGPMGGIALAVGALTTVFGIIVAVAGSPFMLLIFGPFAALFLWFGLDTIGTDVHLLSGGLVIVRRRKKIRVPWQDLERIWVMGSKSADGGVVSLNVILERADGEKVIVPQVAGVIELVALIHAQTSDPIRDRMVEAVREREVFDLGEVHLEPDAILVRRTVRANVRLPYAEVSGVEASGGELRVLGRDGRAVATVNAETVANLHVLDDVVKILAAEAKPAGRPKKVARVKGRKPRPSERERLADVFD